MTFSAKGVLQPHLGEKEDSFLTSEKTASQVGLKSLIDVTRQQPLERAQGKEHLKMTKGDIRGDRQGRMSRRTLLSADFRDKESKTSAQDQPRGPRDPEKS